MKKVAIALVVLVAVGGAGIAWYTFTRNRHDDGSKTVEVIRGTLVEKALAMGEIVPRHEIAVKSKISGTVARLFVAEGDQVRQGDRLLEVRPSPTPLEYAQAKRALELRAMIEKQRQADLQRTQGLLAQGLVAPAEHDQAREAFDQASLQRRMAEEELALLDQGRAVVAGRSVESVILSPMSGHVLQLDVDVGDPVVPLTSYQPGTELLRMADMGELLFRGTVDEIDVGKIREGLSAQIKVGAFPDRLVEGRLGRISLKSHKRDNATVFEVEIDSLRVPDGTVLRSGYSANADVIVRRAADVLVLPERVVDFRGDTTVVKVPAADGQVPEERRLALGMSDGISVEVTDGLQLGDKVLEKEVREIK